MRANGKKSRQVRSKGRDGQYTGHFALMLLICDPSGYPGAKQLLTHFLKLFLDKCEFNFLLPFGSFRIILSRSDHLVNSVRKCKTKSSVLQGHYYSKAVPFITGHPQLVNSIMAVLHKFFLFHPIFRRLRQNNSETFSVVEPVWTFHIMYQKLVWWLFSDKGHKVNFCVVYKERCERRYEPKLHTRYIYIYRVFHDFRA